MSEDEDTRFQVSAIGMINAWKTKMAMPVSLSNGGPRPESTDRNFPIGRRVYVVVEGLTREEAEAFHAGLEAGLMPEIWLSGSGEFS